MTMVFQRKQKKSEIVDKTIGKQLSKRGNPNIAQYGFKPGICPNPAGRPKGSRNKFAEAFLQDFLADWEMAGASAIQSCRLEDPSTYVRVAASLIPKELQLKDGDSALDRLLDQFTDDELKQFINGIATLGVAEDSKGHPRKTLPRA